MEYIWLENIYTPFWVSSYNLIQCVLCCSRFETDVSIQDCGCTVMSY